MRVDKSFTRFIQRLAVAAGGGYYGRGSKTIEAFLDSLANPQANVYGYIGGPTGSETETEEETSYLNKNNMPYPVHYEKFTLNSRAPRSLGGEFHYFDTRAGNIVGQSGKQAVFTLVDALTRSQLLVTTASPARHQGTVALFETNPNSTTTGTPFYPGGAGLGQMQIICSTIQFDWDFTNLSNYPCNLIAYCVTPKNNFPNTQTAQQQWDDALFEEGLGKSLLTYPSNVGAGAAGGRPDASFPGTRPTYYRNWRTNWTIVESFSLYMPAASSQKVFVNGAINKLMNRQTVSDTTDDYIKNTTLQWMVIITGVPVVNKTGDTTQGVTLCTPELAWQCSTKYKFKPARDGNNVISSATASTQTQTNVTFADQRAVQNTAEVVAPNVQVT